MSDQAKELRGRLYSGLKWKFNEETGVFLIRDTETRNWIPLSNPADEMLDPKERMELLHINEEIERWDSIRERLKVVTKPFKVKIECGIHGGRTLEQGLTVSFVKCRNTDWSWGEDIYTNEGGELVSSSYGAYQDNFCSPNGPHWEDKEKPITLYFISRWEKEITAELENDEEVRALFGEPE